MKSQFSIAGIPGSKYFDISPDTLLNAPIQMNSPNEIYFMDINQDGNNDIQIMSYFGTSPGFTSLQIRILSLNPFTSFASDSTNIGANADVLKIYSNGDTIQTAKFISSGVLSFSYNSSGVYTSNQQWIGIGDKFFGIKYQDTVGVCFGWVKVNVSSYNVCLLEEYSLDYIPLGIKQSEKANNNVKIYPNPSSGSFIAETNGVETLDIYMFDVTGKLVLTQNIQGSKATIDGSNLDKGIYNICISNNQQKTNRRLVIIK